MQNESFQLGLPPRNGKCATYFEESQTIQDDCLSLREILVRFGAGQPVPSVENSDDGYPFGDMDDTDFAFGDISDFTDADNFANTAKNRIDAIKQQASQVRQLPKESDPATPVNNPSSPIDDNSNPPKP